MNASQEAFTLPPGSRFTHFTLRVRNLETQSRFYQRAIGLVEISRSETAAHLGPPGSPDPFLTLQHDPAATLPRSRHTGLYHAAFLLPTRTDLADSLRRLMQYGHALSGAADHLVSEALYLDDPEGNGIELYADRPASSWSWRDGEVAMNTLSLDLRGLLTSATSATPSLVPAGVTLGHLHLHVAALSHAERFFHQFLGMNITLSSYRGALFLAAGSYHHHLGANIWAGDRPAPEDSTGLISYRLAVPETDFLPRLQQRATRFGIAVDTPSSTSLSVRDPNQALLEVAAPSP